MARIVVIAICIFVSLAAMGFGLDGGIFSGILAMPAFVRDFGVKKGDGWYIPSEQQSFMNSFPYVGQLLACIMGGWVAERWGRKFGLYLMCFTCIAGVLMQFFATNEALFVAGRFVTYIAVGFATIFAPIYQSECSPKNIRGVMIIFFQLNIVLGSFFISIVNNFTQSIDGKASYKIPIGILLSLPAIMIPGLPFLPESPRWLLKKGREAEARKSLETLYKDDPTFMLENELEYLKTSIKEQSEINASSTWMDCFKGTNRQRTLIAAGIQAFQQATGVSFAFNFGTVFLQSFVSKPFTVVIIQNAVNIVGTVISFFLVDRFGRRPLLFAGSGVMLCSHIAMGICGTLAKGNVSAQQGVVAFFLIYVFGFAFSWGGVAWIVTSEVASNSLREKTQAIASSTNIIFSFIISFTTPFLTNEDKLGLQGKVGFIFAVFVALGAVWVFFSVPEMKNRALEELDVLFQSGVPPRKFKDEVVLDRSGLDSEHKLKELAA